MIYIHRFIWSFADLLWFFWRGLKRCNVALVSSSSFFLGQWVGGKGGQKARTHLSSHWATKLSLFSSMRRSWPPQCGAFGSSATWQPPESYGRLLCWEATEAQIQAADLINKHRGHVRWRRNTEETQPGARCRFPPSSSSVLSVWQPTLVPTALLRNLSGQFTPPKQTHIQTTPPHLFHDYKKKKTITLLGWTPIQRKKTEQPNNILHRHVQPLISTSGAEACACIQSHTP